MSDWRFEYRVVWRREGLKPARALRQTLKGAESQVAHLKWSDTPEARAGDVDDYGQPMNGNGYSDMPKLVSVEIQRRLVGDWECA